LYALQDGFPVKCEFIDVECNRKLPNSTVNQNRTTNGTTPKPYISDAPAYRMTYAQAVKIVANAPKRSNEHYRPSVLVLVIDSLSHSSARRRLPKTLKFLHEEFNMTEFFGHAKVGLNSNPNAAAFLAGEIF
jgi:hypothetical protein